MASPQESNHIIVTGSWIIHTRVLAFVLRITQEFLDSRLEVDTGIPSDQHLNYIVGCLHHLQWEHCIAAKRECLMK